MRGTIFWNFTQSAVTSPRRETPWRSTGNGWLTPRCRRRLVTADRREIPNEPPLHVAMARSLVLPPPLRGRVGEGGSRKFGVCGFPPPPPPPPRPPPPAGRERRKTALPWHPPRPPPHPQRLASCTRRHRS